MAIPAFMASLKPRPKMDQARPFWTCLKEVTWMQWAQFWGWLAGMVMRRHRLLLCRPLRDECLGRLRQVRTYDHLDHPQSPLSGSDCFGRKWPLVFNLALRSAIELGGGFVQTYPKLLVTRSLFGMAERCSALENLTVELRGIASALLQKGSAAGYLIAAVARARLWLTRALLGRVGYLHVDVDPMHLRVLARIGSVPEGKGHGEAPGSPTRKKTKVFIRETGRMLKNHWVLFICAVLSMAGFTFLAHGSQDLFPTYLKSHKGLSSHDVISASIIGNVGAAVGAACAGYILQYIGRRLTVMVFCLLVGCFIPLWIIPDMSSALTAGAFCIQFGVQGANGVVPIHLAQISPRAFRATFSGVAYQASSIVSRASAQTEAMGGDNLKTKLPLINSRPGFLPSCPATPRSKASPSGCWSR